MKKNYWDDSKSIMVLFIAITVWMAVNFWFTGWNISGGFITNLIPSIKVVNIIRKYFQFIRPLFPAIWGGSAIACIGRIYDIAKAEYKSETTKE